MRIYDVVFTRRVEDVVSIRGDTPQEAEAEFLRHREDDDTVRIVEVSESIDETEGAWREFAPEPDGAILTEEDMPRDYSLWPPYDDQGCYLERT